MLSKNKLKLISSLSQKKFRDETGLFVAEGTKLVTDLLQGFQCQLLIATSEWLEQHSPVLATEVIEVTDEELRKASAQKNPQGVLALFSKNETTYNRDVIKNQLVLVLDGVQDPGNLGTIIRIADWFGIRDIFCSEHTADAYNAKTVQATMGALARVRVHVVNLTDFIVSFRGSMPVYGTFLDGDNVYSHSLTPNGMIVMGNEGSGVTEPVARLIQNRLLIPSYPHGEATSESLNVGVATALICAEFRRRV